MRIGVLQPASGKQHTGFDQCLDDGLVGFALVTLVGDDLFAFKPGRIAGKAAVRANGKRDC